jgi:hypothetical protein
MVNMTAVRNYGITAILAGLIGAGIAWYKLEYEPRKEEERARRQAEIQAEVLAERLGYLRGANVGSNPHSYRQDESMPTQIYNDLRCINARLDDHEKTIGKLKKYMGEG